MEAKGGDLTNTQNILQVVLLGSTWFHMVPHGSAIAFRDVFPCGLANRTSSCSRMLLCTTPASVLVVKDMSGKVPCVLAPWNITIWNDYLYKEDSTGNYIIKMYPTKDNLH